LSGNEAAALFAEEDYSQLRNLRLAEARRKVELEAGKRQRGLVYKKPRFWSAYPEFGVGRNIFEGEFGAVSRGALAPFFVNYLRAFAVTCRSTVAQRSHRVFNVMSQDGRYLPNGTFETIGPKRKVGEVLIESRFADDYDEFLEYPEFEDEVGAIQDAMASAFLGGDPRDLTAIPGTLVNSTFRKVRSILSYRSFNRDCGSPMIVQLQENLFRLANGRPSLQASGGTVPGAAAASDALPSPWEMVSMQQSCSDYYLQRSETWCSCIAPLLEKSLSPDALTHYTENFESLRNRMGTTGSAEDRAVSSCRQ
jgi:hypothetical protein